MWGEHFNLSSKLQGERGERGIVARKPLSAGEAWGGTFGRIQSTAIYAAVFHFGKWKGSPMFRKILDSGI